MNVRIPFDTADDHNYMEISNEGFNNENFVSLRIFEDTFDVSVDAANALPHLVQVN
jgi:hypothetical protein